LAETDHDKSKGQSFSLMKSPFCVFSQTALAPLKWY